MDSKQCERCGKPEGAAYSDAGIRYAECWDYCASCSKNLCDACMEKGCCGQVPAASGCEADDRLWNPCKAGCGHSTDRAEGICFRRACQEKLKVVQQG